jgi:DNA-binding response OmpR family regulator
MASILIVEDESLVALGHEFAVKQAGHVVFGTAASVAQATKLLKAGRPDFAMLDVRLLNSELSYPIANQLRRLDIPFVFISGYPLEAVAVETRPVGVLRKPVHFEDLIALLERVRPRG